MRETNHTRSPIAKDHGSFSSRSATNRLVFPALVAVLVAVAAPSANAVVTLLGNPFRPTGADFQIYASQAVDLSTGNGQSGVNPQANLGVEFPDGIGISYDTGGKSLTNFGLGLYSDTQHNTQTTGLSLQYDQLVQASSLTVRLEDFDISSTSTFFNPQKVEPGVLFLGPTGSVIRNALPTDIFSALTFVNSGGKADVWDLSFAQLLGNLHMQDTAISGFVLYADRTNGEVPNSDPYFLVSAGNGIPAIPESGTYLPGIAAIIFVLTFHIHRLCERKKVPVTR
jgi:hypothetical protein